VKLIIEEADVKVAVCQWLNGHYPHLPAITPDMLVASMRGEGEYEEYREYQNGYVLNLDKEKSDAT
jgi:hypothetical protein